MKRKRLTALIFLFISIPVILIGCYDVPEGYRKSCHTRDEALSFIQDYLGHLSVELSEEYSDQVDAYGYRLRIWDANDGDISFHVASKQTLVWDKLMGEFAERYYALTTDYYYSAAHDLYDQYSGASDLIDIHGSDNSMEYSDTVYFDVDMIDRSHLDAAFAQAKGLYEHIIKSCPRIQLEFAFNYPNSYSASWSDDSDGTIYVEKIDAEAYQQILGEYCVDKNTYLEATEFTEAEICDYITRFGRRFIVIKDGVSHEFKDLNLIDNIQYENLSYETMYEVLVRLGFEINGGKNSYSFVGAGKSIYTISREFVVYYENVSDIYYYLKDGKKIKLPLTYGYNNFIDKETFENFTGMALKELL